MAYNDRWNRIIDRIRVLFNDDLLYLHERPSGIIEVRRQYAGDSSNHLIVKRYPKWYPANRVLLELWERDSWSRDYYNDDNDEKARNSLAAMTTATKQEEAKKINEQVRQDEGKLHY